MTFYLHSFLILFLLVTPGFYAAGNSDSLSNNFTEIRLYPYIFYTPETHFAMGAAVIAYFRMTDREDIKLSKITFSGYFSTRKQYYIVLDPEVYLEKEKYLVSGNLYFGNFADKFWGIGNNTPDIENEDFILRTFGFRGNIQRRIVGNLKGGGILQLKKAVIPDQKKNPFLISDSLSGINGGFLFGIGTAISFDTRNNIFFPGKGWLLDMNVVVYNSLLGSHFNFYHAIADARRYFTILPDHIIAFQLYGSFTGGNPPFFELPALGGQNSMRGYFQGRFRDRNFMMSQAEYRALLFWRLGVVVFAGIGEVYSDISDFRKNNLKYSVGTGLRFLLDAAEKLNVRMDIGWGRNSSGIYFAIEEAF